MEMKGNRSFGDEHGSLKLVLLPMLYTCSIVDLRGSCLHGCISKRLVIEARLQYWQACDNSSEATVLVLRSARHGSLYDILEHQNMSERRETRCVDFKR
jgi:hypothetical protein